MTHSRSWSVTVAALLGVLTTFCAAPEPSLPELYPVPSVTLTDHLERSTSLDSFRGSVTIYDFIFTRCAGTCPMMTKRMEVLTTHLQGESGMRFVSISVDPQWDTPERLKEYKARYSDDDRWVFLTGDRSEIVDLSVGGFKLAAGDGEDGGEAILHSSKFVLVDDSGMIRGYYDTFLEGDLARLESDARGLLARM